MADAQPSPLQPFLARIRGAASALTTAQMITLGVTFVGVVGLVAGSAYWLNAPTYTVLFSDLEPDSASAITARLKASKVAYTIDDGGRTIRVPSTHVDELRLEFAGQGLPAQGRIGFEIFDRTAFGVTDFLEHVNYRRALEGELARTIGTIGEVSSARVHIAMGKQSLFPGQDEPAKASVVLKLRQNKPLPPSTIAAISGLVAASVDSLRPESVVIIDNYGRPLTKPADEAAVAGAAQVERQQQIERDTGVRVASLLEPLVGADHVRVNVTARLRADSQEETEERWDPATVVRSKQSVNQGGSGLPAAQGIAGARANLPGEAKPPAPAPPPVSATNSSETTNYEVSRLTRHRVQPRGDIARLSVAVLLDAGPKPRPAEEIQKIHDVVAAAVGFDQDRGDQLTVETIPFEEAPAAEPPPAPWWKTNAPQLLEAAKVIAVFGIALVAMFAVIRPSIRRAFGPPQPALAEGPQVPRTIAEIEGDLDAQLEASLDGQQSRRLPVLTRRVAKLTQQEPESAARLVRSWLAEEDR